MGLRQRGSVIGNYVTASNTSASGMWTGKEAYTLQKKGTWQLPPTFSIAAGAANVNEGASINFTMTTTGIANGTVIPYTASGANITILDSANSSLSGNFVIQNGSNTISFSANLDLTTEGNEVLQITAAGATANVTINDTSTTPVTTDAQFPYTTLLLNGQGTNNSQNNTFLDSSTNTYTLTRNGNSTQGTFSPYGGNWSTSFSDSAGDYLEISSSTAFALGTGDFTIEAWIYPFSYGGSVAGTAIFGTTAGSGTGYSLNLGESQDRMRILSNASGTWADNLVVSAGGGAPLHTWSHIAWVRSGNSMTIYKNGVSVATMSGVSGYNFTSPGNKGFIGFWWDGGTTRYFNGYISNLRVVKGTALYATTFTPSTTPLTAVANTSLLTCQDNRFIDESPNNFTITRYIAPKIQKFNPFSPVITTPTTYSAYFDGTGDNLSLAANASLALGTGDFTIEMWVYNQNTTNRLISYAALGSPILYLNTSNFLLYENYGTGTILTSSIAVPLNTWTHIAVSRASAFTRVFINGVLGASGADTNNWGQNGIYIGTDLATTYMTGSISNLRVVKGTGVYTETFTPSTTPLTAIANTQLLTCQSPTFIDNSINAFPITATGSPTPTTVNPFGVTNTSSEYSTTTFGGSAYFDGSGDYLSNGPYNGQSNFTPSASTAQNKSATIEFWIYPTSTGEGRPYSYCTSSIGNGNDIGIFCYLFGSAQSYNVRFGWYNQTEQYAVTGGSALPNTWTHIAFTYNPSGGVGTLYVNGVSVGTPITGGNVNGGPPNTINGAYNYIGFYPAPGYFTGYMSNFRYVLGSMLYTSNFAPPIAPVTAVANTTMLLNFTNAGVIDNTMMNNLETIADAKISTTQSKFGGTSMSFDGTGDYLVTRFDSIFDMWRGDLTIECWAYFNSLSNAPHLWNIGESNAVREVLYVASSVLRFYSVQNGGGDAIVSSTTLSTNTWYHIALTKSSTTFTLWLNGVSQGTSTTSLYGYALPQSLALGFNHFGSSAGDYLNGYLDDFRITRGFARYTSNFTPPINQLAGK